MKARDLLDGLNFKCISGDLNINIDKVVLDSRQVVPGTAFVAMIGVCVQRLREIKGGEEDDLGQY